MIEFQYIYASLIFVFVKGKETDKERKKKNNEIREARFLVWLD